MKGIRVKTEFRSRVCEHAYMIDDRINDGIETDQETRDWHSRHLEEGIRQADAGEFVDPAEMRQRIEKMVGHPIDPSDTGTETK